MHVSPLLAQSILKPVMIYSGVEDKEERRRLEAVMEAAATFYSEQLFKVRPINHLIPSTMSFHSTSDVSSLRVLQDIRGGAARHHLQVLPQL